MDGYVWKNMWASKKICHPKEGSSSDETKKLGEDMEKRVTSKIVSGRIEGENQELADLGPMPMGGGLLREAEYDCNC